MMGEGFLTLRYNDLRGDENWGVYNDEQKAVALCLSHLCQMRYWSA
jgi:hypothetical protein